MITSLIEIYKNRSRVCVRFLCYKILWITIKCRFCVRTKNTFLFL